MSFGDINPNRISDAQGPEPKAPVQLPSPGSPEPKSGPDDKSQGPEEEMPGLNDAFGQGAGDGAGAAGGAEAADLAVLAV